MTKYIGLDVSLEDTHICIIDEDGKTLSRLIARTEPDELAQAIKEHAPSVKTIILETGGLSSWLQQGLAKHGLPAVIVDARHAKQALSARLNKTDINDAEGLAQLARTGWYKQVLAKRPVTRRIRSVMMARELLVRQRRDISNQIRGLLRGFGLKVGPVSHLRFEARVHELAECEPALLTALEPLLRVRDVLGVQLAKLDKQLSAIACEDSDAKRLMSVPGVGPMTALAFMTALDQPARFAKSADVGAYLGLTSRRYQSGEVNWSGRISKHGDSLARAMLYEAANVLMTRVKRWTPEKAWAVRLAARRGAAKARVALARKLAVILHRIWVDGTTFKWSNTPA